MRGHHRPAGQVQVVIVIDLDAPHRHALDWTHIDNEPRPGPHGPLACPTFLVQQCLTRECEHLVFARERQCVRDRGRLATTPHPFGRSLAAIAQAHDQLSHVRCQSRIRHRELYGAPGGHGAVGVEQPGKQRTSLRLGCAQIAGRNVLVAQDSNGPQTRLQGTHGTVAELAQLSSGGCLSTPRTARCGYRFRNKPGAATA
ncbi:Uncharacterised protein [Mycobacteroides abscessus subsp. massiliense]|nr:Uncharacterised protein [Mycobacteroides abscessus subsp. massiliense]